MKKRINVSDSVYGELLVVSAELNVSGSQQKEKIENLFEDRVLLSAYNKLKSENKELTESTSNINDEQMKRLKKLQAIGIIDADNSKALKLLIDCYMEANTEKIKSTILSI